MVHTVNILSFFASVCNCTVIIEQETNQISGNKMALYVYQTVQIPFVIALAKQLGEFHYKMDF
jgi:hypothetical protein